MVLPSSGPLSASMILAECHESGVAFLSGPTSTPAAGSMVKLYENATPTPVNQVAPHAYSEFYGKSCGKNKILYYSLEEANVNFEYDAQEGFNSITKNSKAGTGTYTPAIGTPSSLTVATLATNWDQGSALLSGGNQTASITASSGVDAFGNNQLWYEFSGSAGEANNDDWSAGSKFTPSVSDRSLDLSFYFNFRTIDNNPSGIGSFDYDDTTYFSVVFNYTASFKSGTDVTCSMAVYSFDNPSIAPTGLSGDWQILDAQDSSFAADNGVERGTTGKWYFEGVLDSTFYGESSPYVYVKPIFADGPGS